MFRISHVAAGMAAASMMFAAPAMANKIQTPSFDKIGVSYVNMDIADESADGFGVNFEKTFTPKVFVSVEHLDVSDTFVTDTGDTTASFDISAELTHANIGYKFYEMGATSAYFSAGYSRAEADSAVALGDNSFYDSYSASDSGWNAQLGVRSLLASNFEVDASVRHLDIDSENDQIFNATARYYLEPHFSLSAGYTHVDSDMSHVNVGVSYHF